MSKMALHQAHNRNSEIFANEWVDERILVNILSL